MHPPTCEYVQIYFIYSVFFGGRQIMYSVADEVWKMMLLTAKIAFNIFKGILSALGMLINYIMQLIDQKKFEKEQQQQRQQFERQNDNNNNNG